jgi:hypothetical protein
MAAHHRNLPPTGRYRYSGEMPLDPIDVEVDVKTPAQQDAADDANGSDSEAAHNIASGNALALVEYLETNGSTQALRLEAGQHLFNQPTTPTLKPQMLKRILAISGLWVFSDELHGDQAVTRDLRRRSGVSSVLLSGSSLIDYISSLGLFAFIFQLAPGGGLPYSLGLSSLLLLFGNWAGRGMVDRHKGQAIPNISLAIFLALSIFQSITAGIGVFLFNGQARVVESKAYALIQEDFNRRRQSIQSLQDPAHPQLQADAQTCQTNQKQLAVMTENNRAYEQLTVETFGRWADRRVPPTNQPRWVLQNWPRDRWPICARFAANKADLQNRARAEQEQLDKREAALAEAPSKVAYLRDSRPQVFEENFRTTESGQVVLRDGVQAFGAAWDFFWSPPAEFRSDLTLSWVYMWISIITSAGAFSLLLWQSLAENTRMSFSVPCGQYRNQLLAGLRRRLPGETQAFFRRKAEYDRRHGIPPASGVSFADIPRLNPEFQTLAYLLQSGDAQVQRVAREQYWMHLLNLYTSSSSTSGEIDYAYLYNHIHRYWRELHGARHAQTSPAATDFRSVSE